MSFIQFNFGHDVIRTRSGIHDTIEESLLCDDLMEIDLRSGETIAVWIDPEEKDYSIEVFREHPENVTLTATTTLPNLPRMLDWCIRHRMQQWRESLTRVATQTISTTQTLQPTCM